MIHPDNRDDLVTAGIAAMKDYDKHDRPAVDGLERTTSAKFADLTASNVTLRCQVETLTKRIREITLFSQMIDFLQASPSEAEVCSVISRTVSQLFPGDSGAIFLLNASPTGLNTRAVWGTPDSVRLNCPTDECLALRRGHEHAANGHEQQCPYVANDRRMRACLPLRARNELLGVLHLIDGSLDADTAETARVAEKCALAKNLADHIALGIANFRLRESLRDLSIRDPLTGLYNRRYMEESLAQEQHRITRSDSHLAVIMIDIDHFKQYNDTFGHDGGDAVLRALGAFFRLNVRGGDIACRYGGEEFILILSPSTAEVARQRAEKIREDARRLKLHHANCDLGTITLSIGVAMFPEQACEAETIVKAADVAMYQAKRAGRDRVVMFADQTRN